MEVEFLSNIRYDLFSSEDEWSRWHTKLGLFGDYFNQASMLPVESAAMLRVSPPRVQSLSPSSKLPSPSTDAFRSQSQPNWYMPPNGLPYSLPPQHIGGETAMGGSRKRSRDDSDELHPTKRLALSSATSAPSMTAPVTAMNTVPTLPPVLTPTSAPVAPMNVSRLPPPHHPPSLPTSYPAPQTLPPTAPSHLPAIMPPIYNRPANWQQIPPLSVPPMPSSMYTNHPFTPRARPASPEPIWRVFCHCLAGRFGLLRPHPADTPLSFLLPRQPQLALPASAFCQHFVDSTPVELSAAAAQCSV